MKTARKLAIITTSLATMLIAAPAQAQEITPSERDVVYSTLVADGVSSADASYIAADPVLSQQVVVGTSVTEGVISGSDSVGDSCSGSQKTVYRIQYFNNVIGNHLAYIKNSTHWCYSSGKVNYADQEPTYYIYTLGKATIQWSGWDSNTVNWYVYNGHTNGGVKSVATGTFTECLAYKLGCYGSVTGTARVYGHYDGTYTTSGVSG